MSSSCRRRCCYLRFPSQIEFQTMLLLVFGNLFAIRRICGHCRTSNDEATFTSPRRAAVSRQMEYAPTSHSPPLRQKQNGGGIGLTSHRMLFRVKLRHPRAALKCIIQLSRVYSVPLSTIKITLEEVARLRILQS